MARRTRRRKPRVNWLPGFSLQAGETASGTDPAGVEGTLVVDPANGGVIQWDAFPLTYDEPNDPADRNASATNQPTLLDYVGSTEYRLRRIVGKFFCFGSADESDDPPVLNGLLDVALGFIVSKTYDDGAPLTDFNEVNPLCRESYDDPWIWRRRWVLNPFFNTAATGLAGIGSFNSIDNFLYARFPNSTPGYSSAVDGPHIDQKTARIIHRHERLFAVVAVRPWSNYDGTALGEMQIDYLLDYRLLASLKPGSSGNRHNASR